MSPSAGRVVSQKMNFWGQGNKGRLTSSAVRRRTDEYPPARLLLPGGLEPQRSDAFATSGLQRCHLGGGVLIVGGDSGVADLHCTNVSPIEPLMQYLFATQESPQTS